MMDKKEKRAEDFGLQEIVLEEIRQFVQKYNLNKVILFGFRARGDFLARQ